MPVAINCWVEPTTKLAGEAGAIAMEDKVGAAVTTGKFTDELVIPAMAAVILVVPAATPVAKPVEEIVAAAGVSLVQVT